MSKKASAIIASILASGPYLAASCATGMHAIHMRDAISQAALKLPKRQNVITPAPSNVAHWTVPENLREMQVTDDAFNAQDFTRFNHATNISVFLQGGVIMNLTDHLTDIALLYSMFPDTAVHNHNYPLRFGEGDWTVTLTKSTGRNTGPLPGAHGQYIAPLNRDVSYDFMTIARWENGLMQHEYLFADTPMMYRQLGLLPDPPARDLPDIYFDPLGSTGNDSAAANKIAQNVSDTAFNDGESSASALLYAPDLHVYGLSDFPMNTTEYLQYLNATRQAFPDIQYLEQNIIAQGEWTATIGMLSGTHTGAWTLPSYMASAPVPPTAKSFNLLHYIIARWEGGQVVDMRVQFDIYGVMAALGVEV